MTKAKKAKRRAAGDGGAYQREDGLWCAQVDAGYRDGKRHRITVYGKSKALALEKLREKRAEVEKGVHSSATLTVEGWMNDWLARQGKQMIKPATIAGYRSKVKTWIIPTIGKVRLSRLEARHVHDLHLAVERAQRSATTANQVHRILSKALKDAMREQLIVRNVAELVSAPAKAAPDRDGFPLDEARKVIKAAGEGPLAARWWGAFLVGARQGEMLGLRWEYVDIDSDDPRADISWSLTAVNYTHGCHPPCGRRFASSCPARTLQIPPRFERVPLAGNLYLLRPKSKKSRRVVPLIPPMVEALRLHRERQAGQPNPFGLVWTHDDGMPIRGRDDWQAWSDLLVKAGVPHQPLHSARHTTATLALTTKADPGVMQEIMGHSTRGQLQAYQHASTDQRREVVTQFGELLGLP